MFLLADNSDDLIIEEIQELCVQQGPAGPPGIPGKPGKDGMSKSLNRHPVTV